MIYSNCNTAMKKNQVLFAIVQLIWFFIVFVKVSYISAQAPVAITPTKTDTLRVLNGGLSVLLKASSYTVLTTDQLVKMYPSTFNTGSVLSTDGFLIGIDSALSFYQTAIKDSALNDGGLSTWKTIGLFTDKIPQSKWLESGWERMRSGVVLYSVKLVSQEKVQQFYKFVFRYIDNKLAFSLFHCPAKIDPHQPQKYLSVALNDSDPFKFTDIQKK